MEDIIHVEIKPSQKMCSICSRKDPDFYVDKLQLRSEVPEVIKNIENIVNKYYSKYVNKKVILKNGIDYFFSHSININKIIKGVDKKYLLVLKKNHRLIGFDRISSKNKYKITYLIRIVNIKVGEHIIYKGERYRVKCVSNDYITIYNNKNKLVINFSKNEDSIKRCDDNNFQ